MICTLGEPLVLNTSGSPNVQIILTVFRKETAQNGILGCQPGSVVEKRDLYHHSTGSSFLWNTMCCCTIESNRIGLFLGVRVEGGREGGRVRMEGGREGGRVRMEGGREGVRVEGGREGGREGGKE